MADSLTRLSRFLSLVLRHHPERIGLCLDRGGWADVDALISGARRAGVSLTVDRLQAVVATNTKQRFAFSDDGRRIRANQGHSTPVDLDLEPAVPPEVLYHGTGARFVPSIRRQGLSAQGRHHVHLSATEDTAAAVGRRHGRPVVLTVAAGSMHRAGRVFFCSVNGVWLTSSVPPGYLAVPSGSG